MNKVITMVTNNSVFINLMVILIIFTGGVASLSMVREFLPAISENDIFVIIKYPDGTPVETTRNAIEKPRKAILDIERKIKKESGSGFIDGLLVVTGRDVGTDFAAIHDDKKPFVRAIQLKIDKYNKLSSRDDGDDDENGGINFQSDEKTAYLVVTITKDHIKSRSAAFVMDNIPKGKYILEGFQDVNNNGRFNRGFFKKEPFGIYKNPKDNRSERFVSLKKLFENRWFEVNSDLTDIVMEIY